MRTFMRLCKTLPLVVVPLFLCATLPASGQATKTHLKPYALSTWSNITCRAKGRFQDRDYCASTVMDQIVADGKSAAHPHGRTRALHPLGSISRRYLAEKHYASLVSH